MYYTCFTIDKPDYFRMINQNQHLFFCTVVMSFPLYHIHPRRQKKKQNSFNFLTSDDDNDKKQIVKIPFFFLI